MSVENECVNLGCAASCCHGTFFNFSQEQYALWFQLAGRPEIDELSFQSFQMINALTDRRDGTGTIFHTTVDSEQGLRDLVRVDGACPLLDESTSNCRAWGKFDACKRLAIRSKQCNAFRERDGLIKI